MTIQELRTRFPHISESTLRLNAGLEDLLVHPQKPGRRTIKAILEAEHHTSIPPDPQSLAKAKESAPEAAPGPDHTFFVAVMTVSEANRASSEHWRVRQKRVKLQHEAVRSAFHPTLEQQRKPTRIQLIRIGSRFLDHSDNLPGSMKGIRDQLAILLGFNDRDPDVVWSYSQEKPAKGQPKGVRISIRWRCLPRCPTCGQIHFTGEQSNP